MDRFAMGRRMRSIERVLLPVLAMIVAAFHLLAGLAMLPWIWQFPPVKEAAGVGVANAEQLLFCTGGIAFACFMMSRYAIGLSKLKSWAVIRAGANYLFGASVVCLAISIALLCEIVGLPWVEPLLGNIIGYLLILLAIETVTNFVLDFYRPRIRGQHARPFYDSRVLGMLGEPGGILRSMANAIDYQFGFKVSETWFYKLLGSAIMPLVFAQIIVIFLLTCIVVVPPGNQAVIERFGRPTSETLKPGVHLTACWPVDRATIIPVDHIQRMVSGHEIENEESLNATGAEQRSPILWTKTHYKKEYQLLVAD